MMYTLEDVVRVAETLPKDGKNGWWVADDDGEWELFDNSDDISSTCSYEDKRDTSKPSCVAGTIVFALDPELFSHLVGDSGAWGSVQICDQFDSEANYFIERAQGEADGGTTWGDAIADAKARLDAAHV